MFGYETLNDMETHEEAQLWYSRLALNQILGRRFSFSVRYNYNDSKVLEGSSREIYGVPKSSETPDWSLSTRRRSPSRSENPM